MMIKLKLLENQANFTALIKSSSLIRRIIRIGKKSKKSATILFGPDSFTLNSTMPL
jgi:hypothetical protein